MQSQALQEREPATCYDCLPFTNAQDGGGAWILLPSHVSLHPLFPRFASLLYSDEPGAILFTLYTVSRQSSRALLVCRAIVLLRSLPPPPGRRPIALACLPAIPLRMKWRPSTSARSGRRAGLPD